MKFIYLFIFGCCCTLSAQEILSEKERAVLKDEILADRFDTLLPQLMDTTGIDMWLLISREYNEDPVMRTMLPATWLNARRRTMIVFYRNKEDNTFEKLAIARYDIGESISSAWNKEEQPDQWKALVDIIKNKDPKKIGINTSNDFGIADGLVQTDYAALKNALPIEYQDKLVSAEKLSIAWIETRSQKEMELYPTLVKQPLNIKTAELKTNKLEFIITSKYD